MHALLMRPYDRSTAQQAIGRAAARGRAQRSAAQRASLSAREQREQREAAGAGGWGWEVEERGKGREGRGAAPDQLLDMEDGALDARLCVCVVVL